MSRSRTWMLAVATLGRLLRRITTEEGASVLMVTHDHEAAMALSDRMVVLGHDGQGIIQDAPPVEVYRRPANESAAQMTGRCSLIRAEASGGMSHSALGSIPICSSTEGPVTLVLRPEGVTFIHDPEVPPPSSALSLQGTLRGRMRDRGRPSRRRLVRSGHGTSGRDPRRHGIPHHRCG